MLIFSPKQRETLISYQVGKPFFKCFVAFVATNFLKNNISYVNQDGSNTRNLLKVQNIMLMFRFHYVEV